MSFNKIKSYIEDKSVRILALSDNFDKWNEVAFSANYLPFWYTLQSCEYQKSYLEGTGNIVSDLSLIVIWDNRPVAIWPLAVIDNLDKKILGSYCSAVFPPVFIDLIPESSKKRIIRSLLEVIKIIQVENDCAKLVFVDFFKGSKEASIWLSSIMSIGARCDVTWELFLDLSMTTEDIRSVFRKSYKPLITKGLKLWDIKILCRDDLTTWVKFRELHHKVSGRVTRSNDSWDRQFKSIVNLSAFLVYLENESGEMVGGGFFEFSKTEANYSVGVYDRSLFDKPLGHVVQYQAILEMKSRGIPWYRIGARCFPGEFSGPTSKESSIGEFKSGFSSVMFPRYWMTIT